MRVVRFIYYLVSPLLTPLLLIPLFLAWIVLAAVVALWETWERAGP